jgi:hypothetical protein
VATELRKVENIFYSDMTEEQAHVYEETKSYYRNLLLEQIEQASESTVYGFNETHHYVTRQYYMIDADYEGSSE